MDDNNESSENAQKTESANSGRLGLSLTLTAKAPAKDNDAVEIEGSIEKSQEGIDATGAYIQVTSSDEEEASEVSTARDSLF